MAWTADIKEDEMVIMRYELVVLHGALDETTGPSVKGRKKRISQGSGGARSTAVLICKCMDILTTVTQEPGVYCRVMPCIRR